MAFSDGTATTLTDFFTQLRTFAVANASFTDNGTVTIGSNTVHILSKGGVFWSFEETINIQSGSFDRFIARGRMTYTAPVAAFTETVPVGQKRFTVFSTYGNSGPFTGHTFYTDGNAVHAVIEVFPNVFNHLSFGTISKGTTFTGGEYLTAGGWFNKNSSTGVYTYSTGNSQLPFADHQTSGFSSGSGTSNAFGFVRYEQTGNDEDDFAPCGSVSDSAIVNTYDLQHARMSNCFTINFPLTSSDASLWTELLGCQPTTFNSRSGLYPMYVRLRTRVTQTSPNLYWIAGIIPYVRVLNIGNIAPKSDVNTDWRVYPLIQRFGDDTVAPISGQIALAYRRV